MPRSSPWKHAGARVLALVAGTLFLLFPHPGRAAREISAVSNPNALVAPDDPAVAALSAEVDRAMPAALDRAGQVAWIEAFVDRRIAYANDWDQWWNVDYWPSPSETLAAGREDCDGIAVVTASLLRRRGFDARLEASIQHVWVAVGEERILGPGKETNFDGQRWTLPSVRALLDWSRYGLGAFPFWRWALLAAWLSICVRAPNARRASVEGLAFLGAILACKLAALKLPDALFFVTLAAAAGLVAWTLFRRAPAGTSQSQALAAGPQDIRSS